MLSVCVLAASSWIWSSTAAAEDIDVFDPPPEVAASLPNLLFVLDNSSNWNTAFADEIAALASTIAGLPVKANGDATVRVGLMLFTETGGPNNNIDGAYVRAAIRDMNTANKAKYAALVSSLQKLGDRTNGGKTGKAMAEVYHYYAGLAPYSGNYKVKTDYLGNRTGTAASLAVYDLPGNALEALGGSTYSSPILGAGCAGNYVIYISNGAAKDGGSDDAVAASLLEAAAAAEGVPGATATIALLPGGSQANLADEWVRFMRRSGRGIVTYTVDVDKSVTGQGPGWTALLKSMATVGGGRYYDVASGNGGAQIGQALREIVSPMPTLNVLPEILPINSVFSSVTLPISADAPGTYLNQVILGEFRPDEQASPRWVGNLKQYQLALADGRLITQDADRNPAINPATGFVNECARSQWTPTTPDTYWSFHPQGACVSVPGSYDSNTPDGAVVEKGAHAYKLRQIAPSIRRMQTCSPDFASCTSLTNFDVSNASITTDLLGTTASDRNALINWQRGQDVLDENYNNGSADMRPSVHGDVVHSRPLAISFGPDTSSRIVVFYGGNDGVLRAINGNRSSSINSVAAGGELWAFVPPEFYPQIKRLRDNSPSISFRGHPDVSPPPLPKPYGFDGPVTAYQQDGNTWIFAAMRRGGRVVYAFDVSRIADSGPNGPQLLWKAGCPSQNSDLNCSLGLDAIGQTWSAPRVMKIPGSAPLLIMGGGYDTCEDGDPNTCAPSSKGSRIYVLDAGNGAVLKTFETKRGVVGDVVVVNDADTGFAMWAYAADLGGNVYRIAGDNPNGPLGSASPETWTITRIASLGCSSAAPCDANRKFMFGPDVVKNGASYYLMLGSGDREKPLRDWASAYGVTNYFFMLQDQPANPTWLSSESGNCGSSVPNVMCINSLFAIGDADPDPAQLAQKKGWYLRLNSHEQVVTSAVTVSGITTFGSHMPAPAVAGACAANLGTGRVYNVQYANAAARSPADSRSQATVGGGLPASPVAGTVDLGGGQLVPFLFGGDASSPLQSSAPIPSN
jgi:type IV pilus assembly protein PilY1